MTLTVFFLTLLGSTSAKAARKMLMKLKPVRRKKEIAGLLEFLYC